MIIKLFKLSLIGLSLTGNITMASHRLADERAWQFFYELFEHNEYATAGACGNMMFESGMYSDNAEQLWNNKTHKSDEWLTTGINNNLVSNPSYVVTLEQFLQKSWYVNSIGFGYGLSQWTGAGRRTNLWNRTIGNGIQIDDIEAQLDYIEWEFNEGAYTTVKSHMISAQTVHQATKTYCDEYEVGGWSDKREEYANDFYRRFAGNPPTGNLITLHAQGNCVPYASLHLDDTYADRIYYADAGTDVFVHAQVGEGDYFELWTVERGGVTLDFETQPNTFFTMHNENVELTAHATGETPTPPEPPEPPTPYFQAGRHRMPIWMYPFARV